MNNLSYQFYTIFSGAWRQRYVILLPLLILPLVGFAVSITSDKQYKAHTSMLIQETAKMNPFLEDLAVSTMLKDRMSALKTLLHSRHILQLVARERGLITDTTSDAKKDRIIARISSQLLMRMAGKDLIHLELTTPAPEGMKEMLVSISHHFVEQLLAPERSSIRDSAFFLDQHLTDRRTELERAEKALANFRDKHTYALPEMHTNNLSRLAQLKQKLAENEAELAGKQRSLGSLDQQLSKTNPIIGRIEEQIVKTRSELALLNTRYKAQHSKVLAAKRILKRLENQRQTLLSNNKDSIDTNKLWDIASQMQVNENQTQQPLLISQLDTLQRTRSRVESLKEEIRWLKNMIADLEPKVKAFGKHEHQLSKLVRDLKVKRDLYDDLLQRHEMAQVTGSLSKFEESKRVKIIDKPYTPTAPINLHWVIFVVAGCFAGLFMGTGFALVFELSDSRIRRKDVLEKLTHSPVLSRLPNHLNA